VVLLSEQATALAVQGATGLVTPLVNGNAGGTASAPESRAAAGGGFVRAVRTDPPVPRASWPGFRLGTETRRRPRHPRRTSAVDRREGGVTGSLLDPQATWVRRLGRYFRNDRV